MEHRITQNHYLYLLLALGLQLIATPFIEKTAGKEIVGPLLSTITLVAAIYAAGFGRKQLAIALGLAGFATFGIWYVAITGEDRASPTASRLIRSAART